MKKIVSLLLALSLIFILSGCSSDNEDNDSLKAPDKEETTQEEIKEYKYLGRPIEWISDVPLSEIKHIKYSCMLNIESEMFITESGDLYLFSQDKMYSNNKVCKKVETDLKFECFYDSADDRDLSYIVGADGIIYDYNEETGVIEAALIGDFEIELKNLHADIYGIMAFEPDYIYYYIEDNSLYKSVYDYVYYDGYYKLESDSTIVDTIPVGETFISMDGRVIKTDKAYYEVGVKNAADVEKYEDVDPIEGLVKIEDVSEQYSDIEYFNSHYIIYKNDDKNLYHYRGNY